MPTVNSELFTAIKNNYKFIFSGKRHLKLTPGVRAWIKDTYSIEMSPEKKTISMQSVYKNIYIGAIFAITHETNLSRRKQLISRAAEKMAHMVTELFRLINPDRYDINLDNEYSSPSGEIGYPHRKETIILTWGNSFTNAFPCLGTSSAILNIRWQAYELRNIFSLKWSK